MQEVKELAVCPTHLDATIFALLATPARPPSIWHWSLACVSAQNGAEAGFRRKPWIIVLSLVPLLVASTRSLNPWYYGRKVEVGTRAPKGAVRRLDVVLVVKERKYTISRRCMTRSNKERAAGEGAGGSYAALFHGPYQAE